MHSMKFEYSAAVDRKMTELVDAAVGLSSTQFIR